VCFAEEAVDTSAPVAAPDLSYGEREQIVKDVLDKLLAEGDELLGEKEPWEIFSGWVRNHLGEIIAGVAGFMTLIGSLLVLLKTNPKFKASIEEFKVSCKGWLKNISEGFDKIIDVCKKTKTETLALKKKIDRLEKSISTLTIALEDVIKLSGADEGKKEIYIMDIEKAKSEIDAVSEIGNDEEVS
jgi:hypothetical protein